MTSLRQEDALPPAARIRSNPVGIVTALAAAYGLAYLVFERAGVGSKDLRDLLGNVAFMPLNLAVAVLNWLASRQTVLDAGVRRALRVCAIGAMSVFIGNCISVWYLLVLQSEADGVAGRFLLPLRQRPAPHRAAAVSAQPPHPRGALEAGPRRRHGACGWLRARLVLRHPADRRGTRRQRDPDAAHLCLPARQPHAAPRHHDGAAARAARQESRGIQLPGGRHSRQHRERPRLRPRPARDRRAQRQLDRWRLPALVPPPHRQCRALLEAPGGEGLDQRRPGAAGPGPEPAPLSRRRRHLLAPRRQWRASLE